MKSIQIKGISIPKKWASAVKITADHIQSASIIWKINPTAKSFRQSRLYDVWINGEPYPPKAICAIAYELATNEVLAPKDFAAAKDGFWHRILKNQGYQVIPKYWDAELIAKSDALVKMTNDQLAKKVEETSSVEPHSRVIPTTVYERSPYVRQAALRRAKGVCERCHQKAPFIKRKSGEPYLEVHHKTPLSRNGSDSLQNTIALCPNCHCEEHDILGMLEGEE